ncbi:uncharacterized protein LOC132799661 [Ziziphus jujuba]|uniref:Uncharacterized protein LOC132799661 n=2 Tax=Ziziphus jujuba TaxID=326968 RepID=A0ABM3ZUB2_ZIZJJ|nr:uncharacterized protein LOC132799661 [Ziziphus jujuba]KAH7542091.1 hypothetical protein FEM48_Zijuj02G0036500 [Ziziphus jujuba var. spinosa]
MASGSSSSSKSEQQHLEKLEAAQQMLNDDDDDYSSKQMKHIALVVIGIVVVMSKPMGMIWAVVKPKRPVYAIEYGLISNATVPGSLESLIGNFRFAMRSYNPNTKTTIYYDSTKILSRNSSNNVTRISFLRFAKVEKKPGYDDIFQYLQHGNVSSNISVRAEIRYGIANWKSSPLRIGIYCQPANVMLERNFQPADFYVDLLLV